MSRTVVYGGVFFAQLALLTVSCGSRTSLEIPDACRKEGATRACQDACGTGVQTCSDGVWSKCDVPVATRSCSDDCGVGQETCEDGEWQSCRVPELKEACMSVCGAGNKICRNGAWQACDAPLPKPPQLMATVRDFSPLTHDDFETSARPGLDEGIVQRMLGADDKPVYAGQPRTRTTSGASNFDQWFRDVPPINQRGALDLPLLPMADNAAMFSYEDRDFFPIDDRLFGKEGREHNYHFTLEAKTTFKYVGGEVFSFTGDDDMWVFINRQLVIDLGGLHGVLSKEVALDDVAPPLGLQQGQIYPLHFFFAERHTIASNFTIRTSIAESGSCE